MQTISWQTLQRLPLYLSHLKELPPDTGHISATGLAQAMELGEVQVRKDLAAVSGRGRPRVGYEPMALIRDIETYLGYDRADRAVLVGAGNLGRALLAYRGFTDYGVEIVAAFDNNPQQRGVKESGKDVLPLALLGEVCRARGVRIGILTVPNSAAQAMCDALIQAGVRAVWNFSNAHLKVPPGVLVRNENMAVSLAVLSRHLAEQSGESLSSRPDGA